MGPGRRVAVVLAAPVLFLGACGGTDPDVAQIDKIVQAIAKDNAALCAHATTQLLGLLGGDKAACAEAARGYQAQAATGIDGDITVHVTGHTATASYTTLAGDARHVTFVKQGDAWLVDAITG